MYESKELFWFNQVCLTHQDKQFQTNAFLRISYSTSTSDFWNFNLLKLSISISEDKKTRAYSLSFQNVIDLYKSIKQVMSNGDPCNQGELQIDKSYIKDQKLIFKFQKTTEDVKVVTIQIYRNESDFGKIMIPFNLFESIAFITKSFLENYDRIYGSLRRDFILAKTFQVSQKLAGDIRNLPNQLVENVTNEPEPHENDGVITKNENQLDELSKYIGDDMDNVPDIPELEKLGKEGTQSFKSKFLEEMGSLYNFEKFLEAARVSDNPFQSVCDRLSGVEGIDPLPNISDKDGKSVIYLSKLFYLSYLRRYVENNVSIPISFIDLKYKVNKDKTQEANIELARNLLLIISYIKCFRNKVESKTNDADINKSILYLTLRCFCDTFTFSFLKGGDINSLSSTIVSRFKYYDGIGFFDYYKGLLDENNCGQISEDEIKSSVTKLSEVIEETPYIDGLHDNLFKNNQVILPSSDNLTIEQIINEVVPVEVDKQVKGKLNSDILKGKSPEIVSLFDGRSENSKSEIIKISNLTRFIKEHEGEIQEYVENEFWTYVKDFENKNFDFSKFKVSLSDLGENIVKALYLWKPEEDSQVKTNYVYFCGKVENEIMGKSEIIASLSEKSTTSSDVDWSGFDKF